MTEHTHRLDGADRCTTCHKHYDDLPEMQHTTDEVTWAIRAAKNDASFLISPNARRRAIDILWYADSSREGAVAGLTILRDGGSWQNLEGRYARSADLAEWRQAADLLGVFDKEK